MVTGVYRVYLDGALISETPNVVTTFGKREILNILAGRSIVPRQIMIGASNAVAPADTDKTLHFPLFSEKIVYSTPIYDVANSKVIYKARVLKQGYYEIREIGLINSASTSDPLAFSFNISESITSTGTVEFDETLSRVGGTALKCTGTPTVTVQSPFDTTNVTPQDELLLAAYTPSGSANIAVTVHNEAGATTAATYSGFDATWQAKAVKLQAFSVPGFDWSTISKIVLVPTASVNIDAFTVRSAAAHGEVLSRATYTTPVVRPDGARIDIEYELGIDLT
jgi:hypothetical protein